MARGQLISGSNGSFEAMEQETLLPLWLSVFPNILCLVRTLHGIWAPPMRDQLRGTPHLRHVLGTARTAHENKPPVDHVEDRRFGGSGTTEEMRLRWLNELRPSHTMIGCAATRERSTLCQAAAAGASFAEQSEHMEHRHVRRCLNMP